MPEFKIYTLIAKKWQVHTMGPDLFCVSERQKRRLYATDLRNAHVHLDNLSKMRVKLAVHTLSEKVCRDMALHENNSREKTQEFIKMCEMLWNVFNDNSPLQSITDQRITNLTRYLIISKPGSKSFNKYSTEGQMCHNTS